MPYLLDLFCGAGGASEGYVQAGYTVTGVDIVPQSHYHHDFVEADAITYLQHMAWAVEGGYITGFDAIHASPPCQRYSTMTRRWGREDEHPDLVPEVRALLQRIGLPYVIENVPGAPLENPTVLCGSMFDLGVRRHRLFETSFDVVQPECRHQQQGKVVGVYGNSGGSSTRDGVKFGGVDSWREAMGIQWMVGRELREAIPPAYTEYIGKAMLDAHPA
jgi:DNA (cytosine-5)-methyltransferase 1